MVLVMFFIFKYSLLFFGELFYILKFYKYSLHCYQLVYDNDPNDLECLEKMISCCGYLGNYDLVIKYSNRYLEIDENNFNFIIIRLKLYLSLRNMMML